jgi:hypothetical protein
MNQDDFIEAILAWGYKLHSTASKRWRMALVRRNADKTLVVLVRRHGVDLLESSLTLDQMMNKDGLLSISMQREGDRFAELGYTEADASIHDIALFVASQIAQDKPVPDELFGRRGIGPTEWALKHGELSKKQSGASAGGDGTMKDVYDAASNGDGEDAYLGDGMWVRPGGGTYER